MILLIFIDKGNKGFLRGVAFTTALVDFLVSIPLFFLFEPTHEMQFVEKVPWIPDFGIYYSMGIDGISLYLILLTTLTTAICVASTWRAIDKHVKEFMISMLLLEVGMIGVFCAMDFFLFYIFWELMLIPMYFMIGVWGGPRRIYAAVKFFLYTMFGSVLMLVAILWLYFHNYQQTGQYDMSILTYHWTYIDPGAQTWLFLAFFLAFAIKVPMFPFHTWLPDAHVEAPTAGSVILAGILLKMGTYGFLRFSLPIFPQATEAAMGWISALAIVGIIYGALVAMVQPDIKKLVAYSSVSHLGFVTLGIFALNTQALEGSILQMINHGISTGALFLIVGVLYERRHSRLIADYGGISARMPVFAAVFMIVTLSSIGLPGLNGFVGEFLILVGVWKSSPIMAALATTGVVWAAVYMLWMFQRVMFGKITNPKNETLTDLNLREIAYFAPLVLFIFTLGVFPTPFIRKMEPTVERLVEKSNFALVRTVEPDNPVGMPGKLPSGPAAVNSKKRVDPHAVTSSASGYVDSADGGKGRS